MNIKFVIRAWAAWAPGLHDRPQWLAWAGDDAAPLPAGRGEAPAVAEMPALARRRLGPLGRGAAQVMYGLADELAPEDGEVPVLLASRYGDAGRSLALLNEVARDEAVSPTAFSLSVHNAIGAVVAIARGDRAVQTALAGGACSAGHAVIEAAGWLADGARELILVCYDEPLPDDYAGFLDEAPTSYAWAWRMAFAGADEPGITLQLTPACAGSPASGPPETANSSDRVPFGLALLRFALGEQQQWTRVQEGQRWDWRRDA